MVKRTTSYIAHKIRSSSKEVTPYFVCNIRGLIFYQFTFIKGIGCLLFWYLISMDNVIK